jgi:hypothetical protein
VRDDAGKRDPVHYKLEYQKLQDYAHEFNQHEYNGTCCQE